VLEGMAVDGGDGDRGRPPVVLLVNVPVESGIVEEPMGVVEADLLAGYVEGELREEALDAGQLLEGWEAAPLHQPVGALGDGQPDDELVEEDLADDPGQGDGIHGFVRPRLGFVAAQRSRTIRRVQERVQAPEYPVDQERQQNRACKLDFVVFFFFFKGVCLCGCVEVGGGGRRRAEEEEQLVSVTIRAIYFYALDLSCVSFRDLEGRWPG
jgi:hypothetical protein